ncbi:MAG: hypothetical protein OXG72_07075 [Acidobacteria bacterium]|nr:hypothetical protein [Acidobacteriota bacterium]
MRRRWIGMVAAVLAVTLAGTGTALAEDPKAAARAIGQAGNAAAASVARDSANAAEVPGHAGTNVPERHIAASRLQDEGRARLADPDDLGGAAGRVVIDGTTLRPDADVPASDPAVVRAEGVTAAPQSAAHRAGGLASGSVQSGRCSPTSYGTRSRAAPAGPSASVSAAAARP